jgi:hypothetical protein
MLNLAHIALAFALTVSLVAGPGSEACALRIPVDWITRDSLNVNVWLVAIGAGASYFYQGRFGRYATHLDALARRARIRKLGPWGRCAGTPFSQAKASNPLPR